MGKTNKKAKHINTGNDFKKLKLKAGKKKPSVNATVTSFKSKSIFITEQLKAQSTVEVLSYTKQSLPELLSHLNHYSASFRSRAIIGIKEIMVQDAKLKTIDPGSVVQRISKMIVDDDADVRKNCISLLQLLFNSIPENNMSPHFPLLLSHLNCAMSHISVKVQRDSLKVVELFLKFYPNLINFHSRTKLFQYFIELISVKENSVNSSGRILATTFALKKETAIQWRIRVLTQVLTLLQINSQSCNNNVKQKEQSCFWNSENLNLKLIQRNSNQRGICLDDIQRTTVVSSNEPTKKKLMITTIPILLQCWIEVAASDMLEKEVETVQTMINVLSITHLFCKDLFDEAENKVSQVAWLRERYYLLFVKHFFNNFPFQQPEIVEPANGSKRKKSSAEAVKASDFHLINLLVCYLCALLSSDQDYDNDSNVIYAALDYLSKFLQLNMKTAFVDAHSIDLVLWSLKRFFGLEKVQDHCNAVLFDLYKYCCAGKCSRSNRSKIIHFMMELYERYSSLKGNSCFEKLLADLPEHFTTACKDFSANRSKICKFSLKDSHLDYLNSILTCMQCAFCRKNESFLQSVSKNLISIVKTMNKNYISLFCASEINCMDCIQFQNWTFGCILPQLTAVSESGFMTLSSYCCNHHVHLQNKTFIIDSLVQRILLPDQTRFTRFDKTEFSCVLKLLFSVLLVTSKESSFSESVSSISNHENLCDHICQSLKQMSEYWPDLWKVQNALFEKKLKCMSTTVKNETILGLLKLGCNLIKQQEQVDVDLREIGRFLAAYSILCQKQSKEVDTRVKTCVVQLLHVPAIMDPYVRILFNSDPSFGVGSLINLLEITELRESYLSFSSELLLYVEAFENSEAGADFSKEIGKLKSLTSALCVVH